jgi:hypothetical protein
MAVSQFDPYRKDILLYKGAGMSPAEMIRALEADHGIEVKRSSFYRYCKTLFADEGPQAANGLHTPALSPAMPEDALVSSVMQGANGEMIDRLVQLIEEVQQGRQEGETRHAAVMEVLQVLPLHDTLDRHSRQFKALFDLLKGVALWKIWLRALLFTGVTWGVVLAALYGYFRGLPF